MRYNYFVFNLLVLSIIFNISTSAQAILNNFWSTDGVVHSISHDSVHNRIFLGGEFSYVGPNTPYLVKSSLEGKIVEAFPKFEFKTIDAIISDNNGGYLIGGSSDDIKNPLYHKLIHLNSKGEIKTFPLDIYGSVKALCLKGDTLFIGGENFKVLANSWYTNLIAYSIAGNRILDWKPDVAGIREILVDGNDLFVLQDRYIDPLQPANGVKRFSVKTLNSQEWNFPTAGPPVQIFINKGKLYLTGAFTKVGDKDRYSIASIDIANHSITDWNPILNNICYNLYFENDLIYLTGNFTSINATSQSYIGIVDNQKGNLVKPIDLKTDAAITGINISGNTLIAYGSFKTVDSKQRRHIAFFDKNSLSLKTDTLHSDGGITKTILTKDNEIIFFGLFESMGGKPVTNTCAIHADGGHALNFSPAVNGPVKVVKYYRNRLYIAGDFYDLNGEERHNISAFNVSTGKLLSWYPTFDIYTTINAIEAIGDSVFIGGSFNTVNNTSRNNLIAVDSTNATLLAWDPNPAGSIIKFVRHKQELFVLGHFDYINDKLSYRLASFTLPDLILKFKNLNDVPFEYISSIDINNNIAYVGGSFTTIGGKQRTQLAAIDLTTGKLTNWAPVVKGTYNNTDDIVNMCSDENYLYVFGYWGWIGTFDKTTYEIVEIEAELETNSSRRIPFACFAYKGKLFIGGLFRGIRRPWGLNKYFTAFCITPPTPENFVLSNDSVCAGAKNVQYSVPVRYGNYMWNFSGAGSTIMEKYNSVVVNFGTNATSGTLSVTSKNICGSSLPRVLEITVSPLPVVKILTEFGNICSDQITYPIVGLPAGGDLSGDGIALNIFSPQKAGVGSHKIHYTYTSPQNCTNSDSTDLMIGICTSISESTLFNVEIYPNPANDLLIVKSENEDINQIIISNELGIEIARYIVYSNNFTIQMNNYSPGIYFLKMMDNEGYIRSTKSFIKK